MRRAFDFERTVEVFTLCPELKLARRIARVVTDLEPGKHDDFNGNFVSGEERSRERAGAESRNEKQEDSKG
jgi:hypothetical protein